MSSNPMLPIINRQFSLGPFCVPLPSSLSPTRGGKVFFHSRQCHHFPLITAVREHSGEQEVQLQKLTPVHCTLGSKQTQGQHPVQDHASACTTGQKPMLLDFP
jgi:hypothetical protein